MSRRLLAALGIDHCLRRPGPAANTSRGGAPYPILGPCLPH
jgi:hypothetical protein